MHLPDELQQVEQRLNSKLARMKKAIIAIIAACIILLIVAIVLIATHSSVDLSAENASLMAENELLSKEIEGTEAQIKEIDIQIVGLETNISNLQATINTTNQQISGLHLYIAKNCEIMHQDLKFNRTNVNAFTISIESSSNTEIAALSSLNMSGNSLPSFCQNSLPDLTSLDLTNNPMINISNNKLPKVADFRVDQGQMLKEFSRNVLPLITGLDLSGNQITVFKENVLSGLQTLNLDNNHISILNECMYDNLQALSFANNPMKEVTNNRFPKLSQISDLRGISVMSGNYFGLIQDLQFRYIQKFEQNTLPNVVGITMRNTQYDFLKIKTNSLPSLRRLSFDNCLIGNFQYFQQLRLLTDLSFNYVDLGKFTDHQYPSLRNLTIKYTDLRVFSGNKLPSLQSLFIQQSNVQDICNGNLMFNLKSLKIRDLQLLTNITCLQKLQSLENLQLLQSDITKFDNYGLPLLKKLQLDGIQYIQSFKNNYLPMLVDLSISINASLDLHAYTKNLQYLSISGASQFTLTNHIFDNLRNFSFISSDLTSPHVTLCNFLRLQNLLLSNIAIPNLQANFYGPLKAIDLEKCGSDFSLGHDFDSTIQYLQIKLTSLDTFSNHSMPNLKTLSLIDAEVCEFENNQLPQATYIYLGANCLRTLDCRGLPAVQELFLGLNFFTDSIADVLIACNLSKLTRLTLFSNEIKNRETTFQKLRQKYPNAAINL